MITPHAHWRYTSLLALYCGLFIVRLFALSGCFYMQSHQCILSPHFKWLLIFHACQCCNLYPNPCYWMFPLLNVLPSHCCHKQPHRVIAGLCLGPNWLWMYFGDNLSDCAFSLLWSQSISMNVHRELAVWGSLHDRLCRTHMKTQKKYKACSSGSKIWITMPELETEWRRGEEGSDAGFSLQQRRENSAQTNLRRQ